MSLGVATVSGLRFSCLDSAVLKNRSVLLATLPPCCLLAVDYCSHMGRFFFFFLKQSHAVYELRRSLEDKVHQVFVLSSPVQRGHNLPEERSVIDIALRSALPNRTVFSNGRVLYLHSPLTWLLGTCACLHLNVNTL